MVRVGIVGLGFMGWIHYLAYQRVAGAKLSAVCSRDERKLAGDWRSIRGNFGPPGEVVDLSAVQRHQTLDEVLADPDIDLVDLCTPTNVHADAAVAALRAGKHVLVEKAIALTADEADAMLAAADRAGKLLMVAHVLPFFPEFAFAAEAVRSGGYGKLLAAHLTRVIARPDWSADIADAAKTGGPAVDLHIHDTHFIGLLAGVPRAVFSTGVVEGDAVTHLTTQYIYGPGGPSVAATSGALVMPGRPFAHGFELYLEQATLSYDGATLKVMAADGSVTGPQLPGGGDPISAFADELSAAVEGVRLGRAPDLLGARLARDALVMCLRECESVRSGEPVLIQDG